MTHVFVWDLKLVGFLAVFGILLLVFIYMVLDITINAFKDWWRK